MTPSPLPDVPLRNREDLSIYWDNHLRVAFEKSACHDLPAMIEASLAHVLMLRSTGALAPERANLLLQGLLELWHELGPESNRTSWTPRVASHDFDGSVEDPYYFLEQRLAAACGIETSDLDVQLARSRNDLDAAVFRMILRRAILDIADLLLQTASDTVEKARATELALIIGHTHRRPAQPTTIAHVLSGLAETLLSQADELVGVYQEMNISPLTSAAFTGTDIPVDADLVAKLLGFGGHFTASYEAVAGAEHFMRLAASLARISATGARWARVLQEWMSLRWVTTPTEFTQGSSIMPQKKNPVVLEHMVSMANAANADMLAVYSTIAAGWYEDSNNATTDVQHTLWAQCDRIIRFLRLHDGVMRAIEVDQLPSDDEIVRSGATTTAVAEALAASGIPWRAAHHTVATLFRAGDPTTWTAQQVSAALTECTGHCDEQLTELVMVSGRLPRRLLERAQAGSPGAKAVDAALDLASDRITTLQRHFADQRASLDAGRAQLIAYAEGAPAAPSLLVVGNTNLDVIVHEATEFPPPGTETIVPDIELRLGGSAANAAVRAAQLGITTTLVSKLADDPATHLVRDLLAGQQHLATAFTTAEQGRSGITVVSESTTQDRSFLSSLGAMETFSLVDVPDHLIAVQAVLCCGYFLLPGLQGRSLGQILGKARQNGAITAVDTGCPDGEWTEQDRTDLLTVVLPNCTYFLPNELEITGLASSDDEAQAALWVHEQTGATVVAKLGPAGALIADKRGVRRFAAPSVRPIDTTGAGDSFNAILLAHLLRGGDLDHAVAIATETTARLITLPADDRRAFLEATTVRAETR